VANNKSTSSQGFPQCNFGGHMSKIIKLYDEFIADPKVKKELLNPDEAFTGIVESEFRMPVDFVAFRSDIGEGDIIGLRDRLNNLRDAANDGRLSSKMAGLFYTPESFAKKDPLIRDLLDEYIHISHNSKAKDLEHKTMFKEIKGLLNKEMGIRGLTSKGLEKLGKMLTRTDAQNRVNKLEEKMIGLRVKLKQGDFTVEKELRQFEKEAAELYADSELQVNTEFIGLIENGLPKLIKEKIRQSELKAKADKTGKTKILDFDYKSKPKDPFITMEELGKLKGPDGKPISKQMRSALYKYQKLTDQLYWRMRKGVEAYVELVARGKTKNSDEFKAMKESLLAKPSREENTNDSLLQRK